MPVSWDIEELGTTYMLIKRKILTSTVVYLYDTIIIWRLQRTKHPLHIQYGQDKMLAEKSKLYVVENMIPPRKTQQNNLSHRAKGLKHPSYGRPFCADSGQEFGESNGLALFT